MLLDNLRDIFLKALQYTPALEQKAMIDFWNKECDSVWKDKEALIKETRAACRAGISPEEIAHAKDLLAAEKDGRVVVLPCNVGDIVYVITQVFNGNKIERAIGSRKIDRIGGNALNPVWVVSTQPYELHFLPSEFGKTVFLTRAEAEKALGKEQG